MDDENQNSSINVLLIICASLIAIVGGGWFLLDGDTGDRSTPPGVARNAALVAPPVSDEVGDVAMPAETPATQPETIVVTPEPAPTAATAQVDADLRKARLAAEADILADPSDSSALYYYGRVLEVEPGHEVAVAELNAVLGQLAIRATGLLAEERYEEAYELSNKVARIRADHALVNEVQQTLDQMSGELVTTAMQLAETGDGETALATLAQAEALPGRNRQYFQAVKDSIADLLQASAEAQAELVESQKAAAALATANWMEKVRGAIGEGLLISPSGSSALDFLAEREDDDEFGQQIRQELISAVLAEAGASVEANTLERAEELLGAATTLAADAAQVDELQASLDQAYIDRESARVLPMTEFKRVNTVPATYPRRAEERGISGWVEVEFTVTPSGDTADITVAGAEPESVFDDPAVEAVEQWTFEPREFRGQTIAQRATAKLVFRIQ